MAYLAFTELAGGTDLPLPDATIAPVEQRRAGFSALEWSVVAIARRDRLSTLRQPGRMSMAMGALFGGVRDPRLADPQLEALRRMAVLTWHRGYSVAPSEVAAFTAAGYSLDQYHALVGSCSARKLAARN